tara:strand:- start:105 stop:254 length:150 start_codon:yes stop_codon:yes gene_type:complete
MTETEFRKQVSYTLTVISYSFQRIAVALLIHAIVATSAWIYFLISGLDK